MRKKINIRHYFLPAFGLLAILLVSCNPTKRLQSDEYLLQKNEIKFKDDIKVSKDDLSETLRQRTNRKILGVFPFYVWAHNVPNPAKFEKRNEKRLKKLEKKNAKRAEKGKDPLELKPFGSWWRETVGEAPVVYDSSATRRSEKQLETYLIKHGWFDAEVESEVDINQSRQRVVVTYKVTGNTPYNIKSLTYEIPDTSLLKHTETARATRNTINVGDQFDIEELEAERKTLNEYFRNRGYYNFNKELIYFDVDSSLNKHAVDLTLGILPRKIPYAGDPDSLLVVPYQTFQINDITIIDRPASRSTSITEVDTILLNDYIIIDQDQLKVNPKTLSQNVLFKKGEYYKLDEVTRTYRRLSALPIVRATSIQFTPVSDDINNRLLNAVISVTPSKKQNVSLEWQGTNRGGFLGVSGKVRYQNKNIFGGAETFEVNIFGGAEAQQLLTESEFSASSESAIKNDIYLNTIEFGPEISLTFPKFLLPVKAERFAKSADPKTRLTANLSYQRRPDYERTRSFGSISYQWSETDQKKWNINPLEISLIKIDRSPEFDAQLAEIGDPFLINSFQDHIIIDSKVGFTYSTYQSSVRSKNHYFYYGEVESAGNILRGIYDMSNAEQNENGSYEMLNIPFAQYLKTLHDARYYRIHNEKMSTAYRLSGGIGIPLKNLNVLPFEKSFFGGGANDIRAWQARTLGPGSYRDPERNFDKIGDILLEANMEYRFDLIKVVEGAIFVDAGNIWTINADDSRPGADFAVDRFLSEIAFGVGTGLRLNFDFFLIRFDLALQMKDPSLDRGERWLFQPKKEYNSYIDNLNNDRAPNDQLSHYTWRWNFNIGIGYPF